MTSEEEKARFHLFITGHTPRSVEAVHNARELLKKVHGHFDLRILDTLENPEEAMRERIVATPMLVRRSPGPRLRIVGDLSDKAQALSLLNTGISLESRGESAEDEMHGEESDPTAEGARRRADRRRKDEQDGSEGQVNG